MLNLIKLVLKFVFVCFTGNYFFVFWLSIDFHLCSLQNITGYLKLNLKQFGFFSLLLTFNADSVSCYCWLDEKKILSSSIMTNKYKPLITSFLPSLNLNGDPLSLDESNFSPSVNVPISLIKTILHATTTKNLCNQMFISKEFCFLFLLRGRHVRDHTVLVGYTTTYATSAYHH